MGTDQRKLTIWVWFSQQRLHWVTRKSNVSTLYVIFLRQGVNTNRLPFTSFYPYEVFRIVMSPIKCMVILTSIALTVFIFCLLISIISTKVEIHRTEFVSSIEPSCNWINIFFQLKFTKRVYTSRGIVRGFHVDYGESKLYLLCEQLPLKAPIEKSSSMDVQ